MEISEHIITELIGLGIPEEIIKSQVSLQNAPASPELDVFHEVCYDDIYMLETVTTLGLSGKTHDWAITRVQAILYPLSKLTHVFRHVFNYPGGPYFTQHEIYNLLQKRAVYKGDISSESDEHYWYFLEFSEGEPVGHLRRKGKWYDLEFLLSKYPIYEMQDHLLSKGILASLRRGNQHPVTLIGPRNRHKVFISANPACGNILLAPFTIPIKS